MTDVSINVVPDEFWYAELSPYFEPWAKYKLLYTNGDAPLHTHMDFVEINFITKGSFINHYNGEVKCYPQNSLMFWKCGETHALYQNEPNSIHCSFLVHKDTFSSICDRYHPENPELRTIPFTDCCLSPEKATYLSSISTKALTQTEATQDFLQLFLHIALSHLFFEKPEIGDKSKLDLDQCVSDIILKFESPEYLTSPITEFYAQYPVCKTTLIKHFKKLTGHTIVEYRNRKRMEYGAKLLANHNFSVTQAAAQVGISSFSYFSKKFKEYYGVLPSEYSQGYYNFPQT